MGSYNEIVIVLVSFYLKQWHIIHYVQKISSALKVVYSR